jgi:hypothetical protein
MKLRWISLVWIFFLLSLGLYGEVTRGFDTIRLGMSYDEALQALTESGFFRFRGLPDVSLRPGTQEPLIRVRGSGFIAEGYLQFRDQVLYSLTLNMNPLMIDHGTFFRQFSQDFGDPQDFNPQRAIWETPMTRLVLERPLIVQFLDRPTFQQIQEEQQIRQSAAEFSRDLFLRSFR